MMALTASIAALAASQGVPVAKFSAPAWDFACLSELQPDGSIASWVQLGMDYTDGSGVLDFNATFKDRHDFAVLKDGLQSVRTEKRPDGLAWVIKASGSFEGSPVLVEATVTEKGPGVIASYVITKGKKKYVGTQCLQSPMPRAVHGYEATLDMYRKERGR